MQPTNGETAWTDFLDHELPGLVASRENIVVVLAEVPEKLAQAEYSVVPLELSVRAIIQEMNLGYRPIASERERLLLHRLDYLVRERNAIRYEA